MVSLSTSDLIGLLVLTVCVAGAIGAVLGFSWGYWNGQRHADLGDIPPHVLRSRGGL